MRPELSPLAQAYVLYQKGFRAEGGSICRNVLDSNPDDSEALHLLGVIEAQNGDPVAALEMIERAITLAPDIERFHLSRSVVLQQLNRLDEALASCDLALKLKPQYARALNGSGAILNKLGRFDEALARYNSAIGSDPRYVDAFVNRGALLHDLNLIKEAISDYDRAISLKPDCAEAFNNRGLALQRLNRFRDALDNFEQAIRSRPNYAEALNNRGFMLHKMGWFAEAIESYQCALSIQPNFTEALNNLGVSLFRVNRFEDALAVYDRALAVSPRSGEALCNVAQVLLVQGDIARAIDSFKRAASMAESPAVHSALIFALNFDPSATAATKQGERCNWAKRHAALLGQALECHANEPDPDRPLRIGYVSSYFRRSAGGFTVGGVITNHDRAAFEVVCYSDTVIEDDVTRRIRERGDLWRNTSGLADGDLAKQIREDRIDILVDAVGHMAGNRLLVFARRPAPVQVTAWGEPTGTGLPVMDYLLADDRLVPACEEPLLAEAVVRLPNFLGYWAPDKIPPVEPLPALANGYVTFGSFNRLEKLSTEILSLWAKILNRLETARLVLKDKALENTAQRMRIEKCFLANGVRPERLRLLAETDRVAHFATYQEIDIALDPFPHSGGMTTLDALWMGIPVVSVRGQTISSRLAAASLSALGLNSFIADDFDHYADIAVRKAGEITGLAELRSGLRDRMAASEVGDPVRYCRAVEAAYRQMWRNWCAVQTSVDHHRAD